MLVIYNGQRGQSLIEAMIVIAMVVLIITGVLAASTFTLRTSQSGKMRSQALKYAQGGIEIVRSLRNNDWSSFALYADKNYCLDTNGDLAEIADITNCTPTLVNLYSRGASFTYVTAEEKMTVMVKVFWPEAAATRSIELTTILTKWK